MDKKMRSEIIQTFHAVKQRHSSARSYQPRDLLPPPLLAAFLVFLHFRLFKSYSDLTVLRITSSLSRNTARKATLANVIEIH